MINKLEMISAFRKKIINNSYSIGTWQQIPDASISEILAKSGYDWVAVDMEHGSISIHQLPNIFRAIELGGVLPFVRISDSQPNFCSQALDAGAAGVIIPMIYSADQLKSLVNACCWPPFGNRGVGFSRANLFGKEFIEYEKEAQSPVIIAQIENIKAVENLESILQVDGLDGIIIGPYDLSASMGLTSKFNHPEFTKVINNIIDICKQSNIPYGYHIVNYDTQELKEKIENKFSLIAYCTDGIFLNESSANPLI